MAGGTFAAGCACEHWTLVGHPADAYHYDAAGELRGHHPDCPDYVAPTPEEQAAGRSAREMRWRSTVSAVSDFLIEDGGRSLTVNWRRDTHRRIWIRTGNAEPLLVNLAPGETLVIRAEAPTPHEPVRVNVDGGFTVR
jgi:hypothetical protein